MKASELVERIKSNKAPLIVDARKTSLWKESRIPGSIHAKVPLILMGKVQFPKDKTTEMVVTCEHGPRPWMARKLLALGSGFKVRLVGSGAATGRGRANGSAAPMARRYAGPGSSRAWYTA